MIAGYTGARRTDRDRENRHSAHSHPYDNPRSLQESSSAHAGFSLDTSLRSASIFILRAGISSSIKDLTPSSIRVNLRVNFSSYGDPCWSRPLLCNISCRCFTESPRTCLRRNPAK